MRDAAIGALYRHLIKPVFFRFDPEFIHDRVTTIGHFIGVFPGASRLLGICSRVRDPILRQTIHGTTFQNPIGLAAGFDKNAVLPDFMYGLGFGYVEVGSVTARAYGGNDGQRLWRLPRSRGLIVNYGLKNDGRKVIKQRLRRRRHMPIGVSIAKTNSPETVGLEEGIADYIASIRSLHAMADYLTINISCPNAFGGEPFTDPERLDALLAAIDHLAVDVPIFVKLSSTHTREELHALIDVMDRHHVDGIVLTNLLKDKQAPQVDEDERSIWSIGGVSGKPVADASDRMLSWAYQYAGDRYVLIGCGGIFTVDDVYRKIALGASLVQLITGMIYQGPQLIHELNIGLAKRLREEGYTSIRELCGSKSIDDVG